MSMWMLCAISCIYKCVYLYVYVYIRIGIRMYVYKCVIIYLCICKYERTCTCIICAHMYICLGMWNVYGYAYLYVC